MTELITNSLPLSARQCALRGAEAFAALSGSSETLCRALPGGLTNLQTSRLPNAHAGVESPSEPIIKLCALTLNRRFDQRALQAQCGCCHNTNCK